MIHHGKQQILVFEKITPGSFRSAAIQPVPSVSTVGMDKIEEIIAEIKQQKERSCREGRRQRVSEGLPTLEERSRKKTVRLKSIGHI
jgi:hypothetical protein